MSCCQCNTETEHRCGRCRTVAYCGSDCQTAHFDNHKEVCFDYDNPDPEHLAGLVDAAIDLDYDEDIGLEILGELQDDPTNQDAINAAIDYVEPHLAFIEGSRRQKKYASKAADYKKKKQKAKKQGGVLGYGKSRYYKYQQGKQQKKLGKEHMRKEEKKQESGGSQHHSSSSGGGSQHHSSSSGGHTGTPKKTVVTTTETYH